jgi:hypothetical protein
MVILRATSNLGGQKEDKRMMCSITHRLNLNHNPNVTKGQAHYWIRHKLN